jgi:hypothetical protein
MNSTQSMPIAFSVNLSEYDQNKIKFKTYKKNEGVSYDILNYDKDILCNDDILNGYYRSVVANPETNEILSFAPPKSIPIESFKERFPDVKNLYVNEIIEGTMVNLFWDNRLNSWEISTKSAIGGNYWFFRTQYDASDPREKQLTFREMFIEACGEDVSTPLNSVYLLQTLPKNFSYSFVMQHPKNHIVLKINRPTLYLVAVYDCSAYPIDHKVYNIPLVKVMEWSELKPFSGLIRFPRTIQPRDVDTYETLENQFCNYFGNGSNNMLVGLMLCDLEYGMRTSIMNKAYENLKEIRGNNPNLQYHFLALYKAGKINEFLHYFPMYKRMFYKFREGSATFIRNVHDAYVIYYVKKQGKEIRIPKPIFKHIFKLHHEIHLQSIQTETPIIITHKIVADWFNSMEPKEQLYHLNYKNREYQEQTTNGENMDAEIAIETNE